MKAIHRGDAAQSRFMPKYSKWCPDFIRARADAEGLELTNAHWVVLGAIREFFDTNDLPPAHHAICKKLERLGAPFPYNGAYAMTQLFPAGGVRQALRFAGFPV